MKTITLTPAYGRDYTSKVAVSQDFQLGKDFIIAQYGHPYDGKPCNKADLPEWTVNIRYSKLRKITNVQSQ